MENLKKGRWKNQKIGWIKEFENRVNGKIKK